MDHTVSWSASDTLRPHDLFKAGSDLVKFVIRSVGLVWRIGHHPQVALPGNDSTGTALTLGVVIRQVRVDTTEAFVTCLIDG